MGERDALVEELYRTALARLCAYGYLVTGSQSDGEELVQAAIVKTFARRRTGLTHVAEAEAYVRATMRTLHIDESRRLARWRRAMPGQAVVARREDVAEDVVGQARVSEALARLTPRVRVAVALRYADDLTVEDVAREMGVTAGTVKSMLSRAREVLGPWLHGSEDDARDEEPAAVRSVGGWAR